MSHDVFISYARRTATPWAQRLRADLEASGLRVFLDEREIPFGAAFPAELARGLLDATVTVVFADQAYFQRPWCVHELRLLTAGYRAQGAPLPSTVVALPDGGDFATVTAQLPPPLASASWPSVAQPDALADAVRTAVARGGVTVRQRLAAINDDTTVRMLEGADQPLAWSDAQAVPSAPSPRVWLTDDAPTPRAESFIGRAADLWRLVHECVSARAFTPARTMVVRGLGGCGKSLLASEFVARHGRRFFPAGVVWINCDAGLDGLLARYVDVWRQIAPGEPAPDDESADTKTRLAQLRDAVGTRLRATTVPGEQLWVIDGLPEPGRAEASGLAAWCPALHHVSVLATTRRADTLRDVDATLALGPLPQDAAVALLTRPPVDAGWMSGAEWKAVVHWAGELPLVLAVLRESLIDGALSIEALRASPKNEPAAASQRLMEALRGEVDDISLRGAAEAFELSWLGLAQDVSLAEAASRLALLAPVALPEPLLAVLATDAQVGTLVRRGWLQAAQTGAGAPRAFSLHRVPASVLRLKMADGSAVFAGLFDGFARLIETNTVEANTVGANASASLARLELHLNVAMTHLFRMQIVAGPDLTAAARRFTHAATRLGGRDRRGLRYLTASTAHFFRDDESFASMLASVTDDSEEAQAAIPHVLQPLRDSPTALGWMARLLADPRDAVRWQALVHAEALDADELAAPLLQAILGDTRVDHTSSFDRYLRTAPRLRTSLSHLLNALARGDGIVRRRAATLVGRALALHGASLEAGGYRAAPLVQHLLHLALTDDDETVRSAAASAAGHDFMPAAWQVLCGAVASDDAASRFRGVIAASAYLDAATAPRAPRSATTEYDDEGALRLQVHFGEPAEPLPGDALQTLIGWVVDLPVPEATIAATTMASLHQGLVACAPWVHERLDRHEYAPVHRLADALAQAKPDFVNAYWWRGQAQVGLGDDARACADFEVVIDKAPGFTEASQPLGEALLRLGTHDCQDHRFEPAAARLLRAGELLPERFEAHHMASLSLYNMNRLDEAEAAATRALGIAPHIGEAWFFRGIARYAAGRAPEALDDLRHATSLSPDDERIVEFKDQVEAWLHGRGNAT